MKYICTECPHLRRNICNYHDGSCGLEKYYMEILPKTSPRWCPLKGGKNAERKKDTYRNTQAVD